MKAVQPSTRKTSYGRLEDGREVFQFTLTNKNGVEVQVINRGAIITAWKVPDRTGKLEDVVLGFDSLAGYLKENPFFGAIVGRYANRIAKGEFELDGKEYTLAQNNNGQHLHGGVNGFDRVFWNIEEHASSKGQAVKLTYNSRDMEEGYPGNLSIEVLYILTDTNELQVEYLATTDKKTVVNLTQHSYFNLTGNVRRDILDHEVMLKCDNMVPVNDVLIPTGELRNVAGTPFDFRKPTKVGARINDDDQQLKLAGGYDHCFAFSSRGDSTANASLYDPSSGRFLEVFTTEPGIQFYCGNFLNGTLVGKNGVVYKHRFGLCLETGHYPDSPNQPQFPSTVLNPGEEYRSRSTYRFSVK